MAHGLRRWSVPLSRVEVPCYWVAGVVFQLLEGIAAGGTRLIGIRLCDRHTTGGLVTVGLRGEMGRPAVLRVFGLRASL